MAPGAWCPGRQAEPLASCAQILNMPPSKMESDCRAVAAQSFKCMEEHTKKEAKVKKLVVKPIMILVVVRAASRAYNGTSYPYEVAVGVVSLLNACTP